MTERKNSVEEARQRFVKEGGVRIGKEEWDEIVIDFSRSYNTYQKADPFRDCHGHSFPEGFLRLADRQATDYGENIAPIYVRRDKSGNYFTLEEKDEYYTERVSRKDEIMPYVALMVVRGKMSIAMACTEIC